MCCRKIPYNTAFFLLIKKKQIKSGVSNKVIQNPNTQPLTSVLLILSIIINLKELSVNKTEISVDRNLVHCISLVNE